MIPRIPRGWPHARSYRVPTVIQSRLKLLRLDLPVPIQVWRVALDGSPPETNLREGLNEAEIARTNRLLDPALRRRKAWSRIALRSILGQRLGCLPCEVPLRLSPAGRPYLPGRGIDFNVSHAGDSALIALLDCPGCVGVDIEAVLPLADLSRLAKLVFTRGERLELAESGQSALETFYRLWTCKEAYLKAIGAGLMIDPAQVEMSLASPLGPLLLRSPDGHTCWLATFVPCPGLTAAVAVCPDP